MDEIVIQHFSDEDQLVWNDVVIRAIEIAHDTHPNDALREACGPLVNWDSISAAENQEKEFHRQLAEILCADLDRFRDWVRKPGDVEMEDEEGHTHVVLARRGQQVVVRGPLYPRDAAEWCAPLWVILRLIESGLIHDLCWDPVPASSAA